MNATVQNLLTIWDLLQGRQIVLAEEPEGVVFTYDPRGGELAVWSLTFSSKQGAGWHLRATRRVATKLTHERAAQLASVWSVEWVDNR